MEKRKRFSQISLRDALEILGIQDLKEWEIEFTPQLPSDHYLETIKRLKANFDVLLSESAKLLLIDAALLEVIQDFPHLKIWKEAALQTDSLTGIVDYLIAPQAKVYQTPLLCVIEAKKDDFEKGLAQCLTEMYACLLYNQPQHQFPIYGIVTNAKSWQFYYLDVDKNCYESLVYSESNMSDILGILHSILTACENNLLAEKTVS
jgi:hypothetical protein